MQGDERKRYCGECKLHVYNLSGMASYDAENLLRNSEGRLCVRYFQRDDGTILTQDCPIGWAKVKQRLSLAAAAMFGLILSLFGTMAVLSFFGRKQVVMGGLIPYTTPTPDRKVVMGAVAMPTPTPTPRVSPSPAPDGRWVVGDVDVRQPIDPEPQIDKELRQRVLTEAGV